MKKIMALIVIMMLIFNIVGFAGTQIPGNSSQDNSFNDYTYHNGTNLILDDGAYWVKDDAPMGNNIKTIYSGNSYEIKLQYDNLNSSVEWALIKSQENEYDLTIKWIDVKGGNFYVRYYNGFDSILSNKLYAPTSFNSNEKEIQHEISHVAIAYVFEFNGDNDDDDNNDEDDGDIDDNDNDNGDDGYTITPKPKSYKMATNKTSNKNSYYIGKTIEYTITVENTGQSAIGVIRVANESLNFYETFDLKVGETKTFVVEYILTKIGSLQNIAAASNNQAAYVLSKNTVDILEIDKIETDTEEEKILEYVPVIESEQNIEEEVTVKLPETGVSPHLIFNSFGQFWRLALHLKK